MNNKINLLLIGRKSFISNVLYKKLKSKISLKKISFEEFSSFTEKRLKKFSHICNCAIKKAYQQKPYLNKNDIDFQIIKKISKLEIKFIFLSSRKVYNKGKNLKENDKLKPVTNYSKNKVITENKIRKIVPTNHIILRISNLIGKPKKVKSQRKVSITFIENFFKYLSQNKKIFYENCYKDFLSENQFAYIFTKILMTKNINGTYNLSLGKKVFIKEIINALNKNQKHNFIEIKKKSKDNFFLNNEKLTKKLKIKIQKKDLLNYCQRI